MYACSYSQTSIDTLPHSPKKAALRSALLPGYGQYYNDKKWKIPVIWAALGTSSYFIIHNYKQYQLFRTAYFNSRNTQNTSTINGLQYTNNDLFLLKTYYRRNLDLSVIITAALYSLNIIDALVDGHLYKFDVSDKLQANIQPQLQSSFNAQKPTIGLSFNLLLR